MKPFSRPDRRPPWFRTAVLAGCGAAITLVVAGLDFFGFEPLWRAELYSQDFRARFGRPAPLDPRLVLLAIDRPGYRDALPAALADAHPLLAEMQDWPWNRTVFAAAVERLGAAGARAVGIDLLFLAPNPGDAALEAALARHRDRVVLAGLFAEQITAAGQQTQWQLPTVANAAAEIATANPTGLVGYVNFWPDADMVVRRGVLRAQLDGVVAESLAARLLAKAGHPLGDDIPPSRRLRFAGGPGRNYTPIPFYELFVPQFWSGKFQAGEFFRDKIVLIAPFGAWAKDSLPTPYRAPLTGAELHLAFLGAELQGAHYRDLPEAAAPLLTAVAGGVALVILLSSARVGGRALWFCGLAGGAVAGSQWVQDQWGWVVPLVAPLLCFVATGASGFLFDFASERREKLRIRRMFATMVSPAVLEYLLADPRRFRLAGERKEATLFFSDLVGFTVIAERLEPEQLAQLLNRYFNPLSEIILAHGGYLDKFEGDAIMADFGVPVWTDPVDPRSHARQACWAALAQQAALRTLRPQLAAEFGCELQARMGLATGIVSAGNMGSDHKFQYTVMGFAVNLAARLEAANKLFRTRILISEETWALARSAVETRFVGALVVRGASRRTRCYELLARAGELSDSQRRARDRFEQAWDWHRQRRFDEARDLFCDVAALDPTDATAQLYVELCEGYRRSPPPADWDGEIRPVP